MTISIDKYLDLYFKINEIIKKYDKYNLAQLIKAVNNKYGKFNITYYKKNNKYMIIINKRIIFKLKNGRDCENTEENIKNLKILLKIVKRIIINRIENILGIFDREI